jgi:hypothetical protein
MLTVDEMAAILGITPQCVKIWNRHELLRRHAYNGKNDCVFEGSPSKICFATRVFRLSLLASSRYAGIVRSFQRPSATTQVLLA